MANCILESLARARGRTLVGGNKRDSIVTTPKCLEPSQPPTRLRKAYLGRTNLEVYMAALDVCQREENENLLMTFAGGIDKYGLDMVMDVYYLSIGEKSKIKSFIARSNTVEALTVYANSLDDHELMNKIHMYYYSKENTPRHIRILMERCSSQQDRADITFSTIHKAKGLEWDHVVLLGGGNFAAYLEEQNELAPRFRIPREELNLLYVSVTRAKKLLTLNAPILQVFRLSRERLEVLVAGAEAGVSACLQCGNKVDGGEMTLVTKVSLGREGRLCHFSYLVLYSLIHFVCYSFVLFFIFSSVFSFFFFPFNLFILFIIFFYLSYSLSSYLSYSLVHCYFLLSPLFITCHW